MKGEFTQETARSCDCVEALQGMLGVAVPTLTIVAESV